MLINEKDALLINKMCTGSFTLNNIGHEIINFFKDDNGDNYCYILPYGGYSNNYKNRINKVIFTSSLSNRRVEIIAIAEIDETMDLHINGNKENKEIHKKQLETLKNVTYGGVTLDKIFKENFGNDEAIYATFKLKNMIKPKDGIKVYLSNNKEDKNKNNVIMVNKNIPSSSLKGYFIKNEKIKNSQKTYNDYENIIKFLNENEDLFEEYNTETIDIKRYESNKFDNINILQIMEKENEEQIYTNLISYWFSKGNLFNLFVKEKMSDKFADDYLLTKEKRIEHGRMDIFAVSADENKAIIIENKILSKLNGIDTEKEISQLDKYIDDIKQKHKVKEDKISGLVFVPDYNVEIIKADIEKQVNKNNKKYFKIVKYSELVEFFINNRTKVKNDVYYKYYDEFIEILKNHTYRTIDEKNKYEMERKFIEAIKKAK